MVLNLECKKWDGGLRHFIAALFIGAGIAHHPRDTRTGQKTTLTRKHS